MMNISVIIPVYKADKYLEKAVQSALQFIQVKEVIIVEDASPDNSLKLCNQIAKTDSRIQVYQHPDKKNHGAGASRNLGINKATQEYLAFLDADDYYLPNRFEAEDIVFQNSKIEGVFGAIGVVFLSDKGKEAFQDKFNNNTLTSVKKQAEGKDVFYGLLGLDQSFGTFFHLNTLTVKRKSLEENQLLFNTQLRLHQDSDFIIKLVYHCYLKTGVIDKAIAIRGVHEDNRITKIENYSNEYNQKQYLLWKSLDSWAKTKKINKSYKNHINLKFTAFKLSLLTGFNKYINIIFAVIKNPKILKTRYRFNYLGK